MNAIVNKNVMQAVDWSRFDLEGWLYQFGAWQYRTDHPYRGNGANAIAVAMSHAGSKNYRSVCPLTDTQRDSIVAAYFNSKKEPLKQQKGKLTCLISDDEARAVQRLILDMKGRSEVLDCWMDALISRYFYGTSFAGMVRPGYTLMDVKFDVKCGLAALHARYPSIVYEPGKKQA